MQLIQSTLVETERVLKALANRRRLTIIKFLALKGPQSVGDISSEIHLSFAATSRHLLQLANANVVEFEQKNTTVFYVLSRTRHSLVHTTLQSLK